MKDRIRAILNEQKITQAEFARRIGIQPSTINMWLKGSREPTEALKRNICSEFHISREWLECGTGEMHPEAPGWTELVSAKTNLPSRPWPRSAPWMITSGSNYGKFWKRSKRRACNGSPFGFFSLFFIFFLTNCKTAL